MIQIHLRRLFPVFLTSIISLAGLPAQIPDSCKLKMGTNIAGPVDYGSEWPFVNIMKYGRRWTAHNDHWVSGGQNPWDSGLLDQIPQDAEGYPLYLPVNVTGAEAAQIVRAIWANTDALPTGLYVVLYDGVGELDVWGDATLVQKGPGRLEFNLSHGNNIFTLEILQSQQGNHVRNIRVLLPGTENTYQQNPFTESWLEKLAPFSTLRFMDWGYTNNSIARQWSQRTHLEDYTWTQKTGVPYEMWAAVCNRLKADAWICVPHAATDDYVYNMAVFFRDHLDPERKIYVEWSNEVWNWIFEQAHYGLDSLDQNLPWPERMGPKIADIMQIWTDAFAGQEHRLVRIMASQHAWWDLGERTFAQIKSEGKAHLIDAVSCAAYMGLNGDTLATWDASATGEDVLRHGAGFSFDNNEYAMRGWHAYANLARQEGKQLLFYEGGQHFTPNPFGSEQPYCPALLECQTLPGMFDLYNRLYDTLRTLSDAEMLLMNFSFIAPKSCKYGSWGLLQSQFDEMPPFADAPKYRAALQAIEVYNGCKQGATPIVETTSVLTTGLQPNPAAGATIWMLPESVEEPYRITIWDMCGRMISSQSVYSTGKGVPVALGGLPAGLLTLRAENSFGHWAARLLHKG